MKNLLLSEQEKKRIINMHKRAIKENQFKDNEESANDDEMSPENMVADKIEQIVDSTKFESKLEDLLSNMTDDELQDIKNNLEEMGITSETSVEDVYDIVQNEMQEINSGEVVEDDEKPKDSPKEQLSKFFAGLGSANLGNWGGIPMALAIGSAVGSFGVGLAYSWGATAVLYGISKILSEKK